MEVKMTKKKGFSSLKPQEAATAIDRLTASQFLEGLAVEGEEGVWRLPLKHHTSIPSVLTVGGQEIPLLTHRLTQEGDDLLLTLMTLKGRGFKIPKIAALRLRFPSAVEAAFEGIIPSIIRVTNVAEKGFSPHLKKVNPYTETIEGLREYFQGQLALEASSSIGRNNAAPEMGFHWNNTPDVAHLNCKLVKQFVAAGLIPEGVERFEAIQQALTEAHPVVEAQVNEILANRILGFRKHCLRPDEVRGWDAKLVLDASCRMGYGHPVRQTEEAAEYVATELATTGYWLVMSDGTLKISEQLPRQAWSNIVPGPKFGVGVKTQMLELEGPGTERAYSLLMEGEEVDPDGMVDAKLAVIPGYRRAKLQQAEVSIEYLERLLGSRTVKVCLQLTEATIGGKEGVTLTTADLEAEDVKDLKGKTFPVPKSGLVTFGLGAQRTKYDAQGKVRRAHRLATSIEVMEARAEKLDIGGLVETRLHLELKVSYSLNLHGHKVLLGHYGKATVRRAADMPTIDGQPVDVVIDHEKIAKFKTKEGVRIPKLVLSGELLNSIGKAMKDQGRTLTVHFNRPERFQCANSWDEALAIITEDYGVTIPDPRVTFETRYGQRPGLLLDTRIGFSSDHTAGQMSGPCLVGTQIAHEVGSDSAVERELAWNRLRLAGQTIDELNRFCLQNYVLTFDSEGPMVDGKRPVLATRWLVKLNRGKVDRVGSSLTLAPEAYQTLPPQVRPDGSWIKDGRTHGWLPELEEGTFSGTLLDPEARERGLLVLVGSLTNGPMWNEHGVFGAKLLPKGLAGLTEGKAPTLAYFLYLPPTVVKLLQNLQDSGRRFKGQPVYNLSQAAKDMDDLIATCCRPHKPEANGGKRILVCDVYGDKTVDDVRMVCSPPRLLQIWKNLVGQMFIRVKAQGTGVETIEEFIPGHLTAAFPKAVYKAVNKKCRGYRFVISVDDDVDPNAVAFPTAYLDYCEAGELYRINRLLKLRLGKEFIPYETLAEAHARASIDLLDQAREECIQAAIAQGRWHVIRGLDQLFHRWPKGFGTGSHVSLRVEDLADDPLTLEEIQVNPAIGCTPVVHPILILLSQLDCDGDNGYLVSPVDYVKLCLAPATVDDPDEEEEDEREDTELPSDWLPPAADPLIVRTLTAQLTAQLRPQRVIDDYGIELDPESDFDIHDSWVSLQPLADLQAGIETKATKLFEAFDMTPLRGGLIGGMTNYKLKNRIGPSALLGLRSNLVGLRQTELHQAVHEAGISKADQGDTFLWDIMGLATSGRLGEVKLAQLDAKTTTRLKDRLEGLFEEPIAVEAAKRAWAQLVERTELGLKPDKALICNVGLLRTTCTPGRLTEQQASRFLANLLQPHLWAQLLAGLNGTSFVPPTPPSPPPAPKGFALGEPIVYRKEGAPISKPETESNPITLGLDALNQLLANLASS
jgi:hypothetical protein